MSLNELFKNSFESAQTKTFTLEDYLKLCAEDRLAYASAAERMIAAIGEPELIDTSQDPRLGRIFYNKTLRIYPGFKDFYGMEDVIEKVVGYFRHSAQGLEEKKQILYLLGPVGGGKSSLSEKLKELMETHPIYVLATDKGEISPVFESPLGLFNSNRDLIRHIESEYGIDRRYMGYIPSPWAIKRLREFGGDISRFRVVKLKPSRLEQIAITKTEPGDDNNQDISTLVGKVDIRKLEHYSQNDVDAYSFSGGLCRANQGLLEMVELFKSPIKVLHPLLTATQEGNYTGTESISAIPFQGIVLAHCFSEDTELLTSTGWKTINDVAVGTMMATIDKKTGKIEYQPALEKYVYDNQSEVYAFKGNYVDHLVTSKHKMLYKTTGDLSETTADILNLFGVLLPVSGIKNNKDCFYYKNLDEVRLHAWCLDNTPIYKDIGFYDYTWKTNSFYQFSSLIQLLDGLNIDHSTESDGEQFIARASLELKFSPMLSGIHRELSLEQVKTLFTEWSSITGYKGISDNNNLYYIHTPSKHHKDFIQELSALNGMHSYVTEQGQYLVSVKFDTDSITTFDITKTPMSYQGNVWCVKTRNHTLIARRNDTVLITGNSNESEWEIFKNNKNNEAFIDRVSTIKVPYTLRVAEEVLIYKKMLENSGLKDAPCAPQTLEMLAQFSVLTRLKEHENSTLYSKLRVYNGDNIKEQDPKAKSYQEYKDAAGVDEGMSGISTRFAYKILSQTFNYSPEEVAADPVHLMIVLENAIKQEQLPEEKEQKYLSFIKSELAPRYAEFLGNEIQKAYLESYSEYGQNLFMRYLSYADAWIQDVDYKDPDTGLLMDRAQLNAELEKIEKPAGITNPKDFRNEVVNFCLRAKAKTGVDVEWTSYGTIRDVIEKRMFSQVEDLLPVISFDTKKDKLLEQKHNEFIERMSKKHTHRQIRRLVEWYMRVRKTS